MTFNLKYNKISFQSQIAEKCTSRYTVDQQLGPPKRPSVPLGGLSDIAALEGLKGIAHTTTLK